MQHVGIVINKESWAMLQAEPLYSPRFITREDTHEVAIVTRVEALDFFVDGHPPFIFDFETWCSSDGIWVVSLQYCVRPIFGSPQHGVFYLNPRQQTDAALLRHIIKHETLTAVFLSEDCNEHYTVDIVHDPQALDRWQQLFSYLLIEEDFQGANAEDLAFISAVEELHTKGEEERSRSQEKTKEVDCMTDTLVVLVTTGSEEEAEIIARTLVEERRAACVNIINPVRSIYRWQGKLQNGREWLLIIKTHASCFTALEKRVHELHSYKVPEVIALPLATGSNTYLDWIRNEVTK